MSDTLTPSDKEEKNRREKERKKMKRNKLQFTLFFETNIFFFYLYFLFDGKMMKEKPREKGKIKRRNLSKVTEQHNRSQTKH